jgi:hypothetical protein
MDRSRWPHNKLHVWLARTNVATSTLSVLKQTNFYNDLSQIILNSVNFIEKSTNIHDIK